LGFAAGVPISEVRMILQRPPLRTSESKGHQQPIDPVWLRFESPHDELAAKNDADFRTATPGKSDCGRTLRQSQHIAGRDIRG
jgi:hypothetical protein